MYQPSHFVETRMEVLHALIQQHALATIVVQSERGLVADHIPLQWQADGTAHGKLVGHVAKANPLWKTDPQKDILVIFQGPQAYISPNWYASKPSTGGKVVPTWNYAVVHVQGKLRALPPEQSAALLAILQQLTDQHEANQAHPWQVSDAPADYLEKLARAIVGIEISISQISGKWKVSQNKSGADMTSLVAGLTASAASSDNQALAMAALVQQFARKADES